MSLAKLDGQFNSWERYVEAPKAASQREINGKLSGTLKARKEYNQFRPHQALGYATPAEVYQDPAAHGAKSKRE